MAGTISLRYPLTGQKYEIRVTGKAFKGAPAYAGEYSEHTWPDTAISGYRDSASVRRFEEAIAQTITADLESTQRMKDGLILLYRLRQRDLQWRQSKVYHLWLAWREVKTFIRKTLRNS